MIHIASGDLWAGAEVQLYNLAKELDQYSDISLSVILLNHGLLEQNLLEQNISVTVFDETRLNTVQILFKIIKQVYSQKPDLIHTHRFKENIIGSIATLLSLRTLSIRTCHGAPEFTFNFWQMHKTIMQRLDVMCGKYIQKCVISVSDELTQKLQKIFHKNSIVTIENGIDIDEVVKKSKATIDANFFDDRIKIAFVGRLVPVKQIDLFIEIAAHLVKKDPSLYEFYIFGEGPLLDDTKNLISHYNIGNNVFLMGFKRNVSAYLAKLDLLLITSMHEGLPMTLLEALALKIPVISTAVGGIPAALGTGKFGTIIDPDNPKPKFIEEINYFANNRTPFIFKSEAGLQFLRSKLSSRHMAEKYRATYSAVLR
ncbi:MAG: glycosyltransferase [Gammaproteobacteria bacterium]|nr:glycosyltransferase [Gammaproteobacteria bacterium]